MTSPAEVRLKVSEGFPVVLDTTSPALFIQVGAAVVGVDVVDVVVRAAGGLSPNECFHQLALAVVSEAVGISVALRRCLGRRRR